MSVLSSFRNLAMYNFGVTVVKDMEEAERQYLEQNIQAALVKERLTLRTLLPSDN